MSSAERFGEECDEADADEQHDQGDTHHQQVGAEESAAECSQAAVGTHATNR